MIIICIVASCNSCDGVTNRRRVELCIVSVDRIFIPLTIILCFSNIFCQLANLSLNIADSFSKIVADQIIVILVFGCFCLALIPIGIQSRLFLVCSCYCSHVSSVRSCGCIQSCDGFGSCRLQSVDVQRSHRLVNLTLIGGDISTLDGILHGFHSSLGSIKLSLNLRYLQADLVGLLCIIK